ncbi:MAG: RNA-binding protein [Bacteroidales bacterium]|nr:RNA-binding protein [Bacteroidales bacterium]
MVIFVANIPFKSRGKDLKKLFEEHGTVERAYIIFDKEKRLSKGYGFVEMPNEDEAKDAIEKLNGYELRGKALVVTEANSKKKEGVENTQEENKETDHKEEENSL